MDEGSRRVNSSDKVIEALLELGNPADRWTRAELLDRTLRTAMALTYADAVIILTSHRGREERLVLHVGSAVLAALQPPPEGSEVLRRLAQGRQPLLADLAEDAEIATDGCPGIEPGPVIFSPLRQHNLAPAYVAAYRRHGRARFSTHDTQSMLLLGAWLSASLENLRLANTREKLAVTDDLTDIYNFRFLKNALGRETRRAHRFGHELSVVKVDLDPLASEEAANDGPPEGAIATELAVVLARQVRSFDILAKSGANQFMLLLPETSRPGALEVAERARGAVEGHAFPGVESGAITVSLGVASFPLDAADAEGLLAAATRALETAREHGKNCVATPTSRAA